MTRKEEKLRKWKPQTQWSKTQNGRFFNFFLKFMVKTHFGKHIKTGESTSTVWNDVASIVNGLFDLNFFKCTKNLQFWVFEHSNKKFHLRNFLVLIFWVIIAFPLFKQFFCKSNFCVSFFSRNKKWRQK